MSMESGRQDLSAIEQNAGRILIGGLVAGIILHALGISLDIFTLWVVGDLVAVVGIIVAGVGYIGRSWRANTAAQSGQSSRIVEDNATGILVGGVIAGVVVSLIGVLTDIFGLAVFGGIMACLSIVLAGLGYIGRWRDRIRGVVNEKNQSNHVRG